MTCNVTGTAISPNGQIKPGARISFRRAQLDVVSQEGSFVIPDDYIIQTALDGTVDFDILPGVYDATTVAVGGRTVAFRVSVPDEPAADFADLLNASYVEIPPASVTQAQQARDAAIAARNAAQAAEAAAELARDEALLYDGPKVDTFAELASVTPAQLAVGEYIRVIETGAVYQRVASGGDLDYTGSGGVRLAVVGQTRTLEQYGADPTGVADSSAARNKAAAWAAATGGTIVLSPGATYRIDTSATPVFGTVRVEATGATVVGGGANSIWAVDGSVDLNGGIYDSCLALDLNAIAGYHDHLIMRRVRAIGTGRLVACTSSDFSKYWGWRIVSITGCEQDNSGHPRQTGMYLAVRRIDVGHVIGHRATNVERRAIMLGQISNTHRGMLGSIVVENAYIDGVGYDGAAPTPECQAVQINDADIGIIRNSFARDVFFDDGIIGRGMEGLYIRGGRFGWVEGNTLLDAGGNQGGILLKCLDGGAVKNTVEYTRQRGLIGIAALKSRHKVEDNTIIISGTPAGEEGYGIQLMTEDDDNGIDQFQDAMPARNAIYFKGEQGVGGGLEIGIYVDFGAKTHNSRSLIDANKIVGLNPAVPVTRAIVFQRGGNGTIIGPGNIAQNCTVYLDIFRTQEIAELELRGRLLDVAKVVQCRNVAASPEVAIGLLRVGVVVENTGDYTDALLDGVNAALFDGFGIRDVVDDGSEYRGLYRQIFRQWGRGAGSFLARSPVCAPTSTYGFKSYIHNFGNAGATVNILGGDMRLMNRIVDLETVGATMARVCIDAVDFRSIGSSGDHKMVTNPTQVIDLVVDGSTLHAATGAAMAAAGFGINTAGKYSGKMVQNTTNGKFYVAAGSAPTAQWLALDGTAAITPV